MTPWGGSSYGQYGQLHRVAFVEGQRESPLIGSTSGHQLPILLWRSDEAGGSSNSAQLMQLVDQSQSHQYLILFLSPVLSFLLLSFLRLLSFVWILWLICFHRYCLLLSITSLTSKSLKKESPSDNSDTCWPEAATDNRKRHLICGCADYI